MTNTLAALAVLEPKHILWLFLIIFVGFFVLLRVILPLSIFVIALIEKRRPCMLAPAPGEPARVSPQIDAAIAAGLQPLGLHTDGDQGIKKGVIMPLLSPDGQVLVLVSHRMNRRCCLVSRLSTGRWLVTCDIVGTADLSGLEEEVMLPGVPFDTLLYYHRQRLAPYGSAVASFVPETFVQELYDHQRVCAEKLIAMGYARAAGAEPFRWRYTLPGAARIAFGAARSFSALRRQQRFAQAKAAEAEAARFRAFALQSAASGTSTVPGAASPNSAATNVSSSKDSCSPSVMADNN